MTQKVGKRRLCGYPGCGKKSTHLMRAQEWNGLDEDAHMCLRHSRLLSSELLGTWDPVNPECWERART